MSEKPIAIAAGGTGGHLFPGQALAQELMRRGRTVVLVTDERVRQFDRLFPGVEVHQVPSATPGSGGAAGLARAMPKLMLGAARAYLLLGRIKPAAMIGFGGYPTLPPMVAAVAHGIPTAVHEQNAVLGRVNRLLAPRVKAIASTFDDPKYLKAEDKKRLVATGNPVRDAVRAVAGTPYPNLETQGPFNLLIFGGSQGARVMSDVVPDALAALDEGRRARLQVTQQCRAEDLDRVRAIYQAAGIKAELSAFFDDMPRLIANAHLVIGRSGASTVSELGVIGRPSILVPLPHSLDNDQKANAELLSESGAALMIEQQDFTPQSLSRILADLMAKPERLREIAAAALARGEPQAVERLADLVDALAGYKTGES